MRWRAHNFRRQQPQRWYCTCSQSSGTHTENPSARPPGPPGQINPDHPDIIHPWECEN